MRTEEHTDKVDGNGRAAIPARTIGRYDTGTPGPLLILVGGMHGNERAGVAAITRVLEALHEQQLPMQGRVLALYGNLAALATGERYIGEDLNRMWTVEAVAALRQQDPVLDSAEQQEQRALLVRIEVELAGSQAQIIFLDLHSASADGAPFCLMSDTLQNRPIAFAYNMPVILGLEESIEGTLLNYFGERGHIALGVEGGQHQDTHTADRHTSVIWITLVAAGLLRADQVPDLEGHQAQLLEATSGLSPVVEIFHRQGLQDGEPFKMEDGFENFTPVHKGLVLAYDGRGAVKAPANGLLVLPRYQPLGNDGFFLGRPVKVGWLKLSALLRRLHLEGLLRALPGVRRHPLMPDALQVDTGIARWYAVEIFHLFGYRKCRKDDRHLVFTRRPEGRNGRMKEQEIIRRMGP